MIQQFNSDSEENTIFIAETFAKSLHKNDIVILSGDLGAGKTLFTKGVAMYFGVDSETVSSPSFTLLNRYDRGNTMIFHIDLYRLSENGDIFFEEVEEVMNSGGITLIEWGEKYQHFLDEYAEGNIYNVRIRVLDSDKREIIIEKNSGH